MGSEVRARAGAKVLSEGEGATEGSGGWQASKLWLSILCVPTAESFSHQNVYSKKASCRQDAGMAPACTAGRSERPSHWLGARPPA